MILDPTGDLIYVMLDNTEYGALLNLLAQNLDWEDLPEPLQDAIDNLLADEAETENAAPIILSTILADLNQQ